MEHTLHFGKLSAKVETYGGELVSLRDGHGTEFIWGGDPASWTGRNPILFPIVGELKGGMTKFNGIPYQLPRHGFARRSEFSVEEIGESHIVFALSESPDTLLQYPFRFTLRVKHQLLQNGFRTEFSIENRSEKPMPFCIGGHTAFRCPLYAGERFEEYQLVFDKAENADSIPQTPDGLLYHDRLEPILRHSDTISLTYGTFDRADTLTFEGLASTGVSLQHRGSGHGVHMDFTDFPMIAFWTKPNTHAPYICIEPWHGCASFDNEGGDFIEKRHCVVLAPGEMNRLGYTVTILGNQMRL